MTNRRGLLATAAGLAGLGFWKMTQTADAAAEKKVFEVQKSDAFLKPAWMKTPVDMGVFAESSSFLFKAPFIPEWNEMQAAIDTELADFWLGKEKSAKKALTALQKSLESIIKSAG